SRNRQAAIARGNISSLFECLRLEMLERQAPGDELVGQHVTRSYRNRVFAARGKIQHLPVVSRHHQILQGEYFSHEILAESFVGIPQGRVSQAATGADRIFERDLSLPFWLEKIFPRFEVSSGNEIGIVDE